MTAHLPGQLATRSRRYPLTDAWTVVGLILGLLMPVVAAWVYPTYRHNMPDPFVEQTRLLELPFVICEALVVGWALYRRMELRQVAQSLPRDCLIAVAVMMAGVWGSTLFVSRVPGISLMISLTTVVHLLFALSVFYLLKRGGAEAIDRFAAGLGLGLVALTALTAWWFLLPPPLSQVPDRFIEWASALPGFINVRHLGSWTGAVTALFAAIILNKRSDERASWHDLAFFLAATMTIWSGTRAAVLAIAIACAIMVVSQWRLPSLRIIGRLLVLTTVALLLAYLLKPNDDPAFFLFRWAQGSGTADDLTSLRITLWSQTYAKWLQAPWFGWGSGSTFWEVYIGWPHTQPHNFVLQFLISWGLVGASGALWLLGRSTIAAHRRALADHSVWPLNVALYSLLIMAALEGMLHYPRFIMLIMVLYAMIFRFGTSAQSGARAD